MVFRVILVAIAIVACAHAIPKPNDIVPETKSNSQFLEGATTSAHSAAKQIVTEMIQAGNGWSACEELANSTREEVTDAVKNSQDMLDSLDKGCRCAGLGQDEVTRTKNEVDAAFSAVTIATNALDTATNAEVQLSPQEFQQLQKTECGWIMTDVGYLAAHLTYTTAVRTLAEAKTTYTLSLQMYDEAVTEAASLKLECECATQSAHAAAWATANEDNDANAAAWSQAHHIDCVVQKIPEAQCLFGPAPGLTQPTLCDDIASVSCAAESGSAATAEQITETTSATSLSGFVQHTHGQECGTGGEHSHETDLGKAKNIEDCASKCIAQEGCNYFSIGTGVKLNKCYWEHDRACSDFAQNVNDSYDVWRKMETMQQWSRPIVLG